MEEKSSLQSQDLKINSNISHQILLRPDYLSYASHIYSCIGLLLYSTYLILCLFSFVGISEETSDKH